MHVSVGELARLAPDALRGLGLSQAVADRAAASVVWGEVIHGLSLRFLAERGAEIEKASETYFRLEESGAEELRIDKLDAYGHSLITAGPRALDLAEARAAANDAGLTLLRNTSGTFLAGELICHALSRGHPLMTVFSAGEGAAPFEGDGCLIGLPKEQGGEVHAASLAAISNNRGRQLLQLLGLSHVASKAAAEALANFTARTDGSPRLAVLAWWRPLEPRGKGLLAEHLASAPAEAEPQWCQVSDFDARQMAALHSGLNVHEEAWQALGNYIQRTRVETSERSRAQAG